MYDGNKKNIVLFYLAKAFQMLSPLLIIIIIAKSMSKEEFAYTVLAQSIAIFCGSLIEYGFSYSGARLISENRHNNSEVAKIFYGITLAKTIILASSLVFLSIVIHFSNLPKVYWIGTFFLTVSQGYNLLWYFQGIDRVLLGVMADSLSRVVFLIFVIIKPDNGATFIGFLGSIQISAVLILFIYVVKSHRVVLSVKYSCRLIKESFSLFIFRIGALIYSGGSIAILGMVATPAALANYAGADRLFRAAAGLTAPIGDAFFANISEALIASPSRAEKLFQDASRLMLAVSLIIFFGGEIISGFLVKIVLGSQYYESTIILRILLLTIPLIGLGTILFVLYLMPRKQDVAFASATILAGLWILFSVYFLVPQFGVRFMAWSIVISEGIICLVGLFSIAIYKGRKTSGKYE